MDLIILFLKIDNTVKNIEINIYSTYEEKIKYFLTSYLPIDDMIELEWGNKQHLF